MGYQLRFGAFELNLVTEELRKFGTPIKLAPQPFKVLALLASQSGQIVVREQIQLQVWGEETYVDFEQGMNHCINQIRHALNDSADTPRYIETLPRRGYRFTAPVEALKLADESHEVRVAFIEPAASAPTTAAAGPAEALASLAVRSIPARPETGGFSPDRPLEPTPPTLPQSRPSTRSWTWRMVALASLIVALASGSFAAWRARVTFQHVSVSSGPALRQRKSVAVLGFQNVSGRADAAWCSTAFSEMLRTELAAGDQLHVIEGETIDRMKSDLHLAETDSLAWDTLQRVQKMVGADYVLLGSYTELGKEAGGQIRLDLRLQETHSGETVASVAETGTVDRIFDLVSRVGSSIRPKLGVSPVSIEDAGGVRAMLPSDTKAARLYSQALARLRLFDAMAARDLLRESIATEPNSAPAHAALAAAWKMLGYEQDARDEARKAYKLASNLPREQRLSIEARYRELSREWDEAIRLYQGLWRDSPDNLEYGLRLASAQKSAGKAKDAMATVQMLRALPTPGRDDPRIDLAEASAAFALGRFKQSQDASTAAAEKSELLGSNHILARAKTAQAKVHFEQQDLPAALNLFRQSLDLYQQVGDATGTSSSLVNIASVLQEQGQVLEAQGMYDKALALYLKIGDKSSAALTLNNMGGLYQRQLDFPEAKKAYAESLDLYRELGDKLNLGFVLNNMGEVLYLDGDLAGARKMHERALALDRENFNQVGTAEALADLGQALAAQGDLGDARRAQQESLAIWTKVGDADAAADAGLALAQLSLAESRWQEAETAARNLAAEAVQTKRLEREARAQMVLAQALLPQDKLAEAIVAVTRAESRLSEIPDPAFRLEIRIRASRIHGFSGVPGAQLHAIESLQQSLANASSGGLLPQQMEAELALGELEIAAGKPDAGRARLHSLQKQAAARGYMLLACQAAVRARPSLLRSSGFSEPAAKNSEQRLHGSNELVIIAQPVVNN